MFPLHYQSLAASLPRTALILRFYANPLKIDEWSEPACRLAAQAFSKARPSLYERG
jgi:hypothetical protein